MNSHKYVFSKIPNTIRGRILIKIMKEFLNSDRYTMRVRGQGLIKGENWRLYTYGAPLNKSTHLRVYFYEKEV
mgnify:FL=1|jgi:hypothetical protein